MKRNSTRDTIALCLIVFGSLAVSGGLGAWLVRGLILERGPHFQRPGSTRGYYASTIWKGDLWYCKSTPTESGKVPECHIRRRNLETGDDRETNLVFTEEPVGLLATEDRLWIIGGGANGSNVYETNGESVLRTSPSLPYPQPGPSGSPTFVSGHFVQDGLLSSVREYQPEHYRIVNLVDGEWLDGSEVILPGLSRRWEDDERLQRKVLAPRTCAIPATTGPTVSIPTLTVVSDHGRFHLFIFDVFRNFMAYREGFEFLEPTDNSVSVLSPANAPPEASGWEYMAEKSYAPFFEATVQHGVPVIVANQAGPLNEFQPGRWRIWTRTTRNGFEAIDNVPTRLLWVPVLVSSPNHDACYLLSQHEMQGSEVFAVDEKSLRKLPHDLPGSEWPTLMWYVRLSIAIGAAWSIHSMLLVFGVDCFLARQDRAIVSGHGSATLASIPRRAVARGVDLALVFLPMALHLVSLAGTADPVVVSYELWQQETRVTSIPLNNWQGNFNMLIRGNWPYLVSAYATLQWSILGSLAVWFALVAVEGAYGVTPGKWLCGLRTMRTTLRPCGFARAILRDVLLCVDVPFLLTPIPAVLSCAGSPHRQRLGDRVADTVVVEARSSRPLSPNDAVVPQRASIPPGHEFG